MSITTKKPPIKESIGAQYVCFDQSGNDEYSGTYSEEVEKTEVVKSVKVTENAENTDVYSSGGVYDTDSSTASTDIEVEVIAFPAENISQDAWRCCRCRRAGSFRRERSTAVLCVWQGGQTETWKSEIGMVSKM